MPLTQRDLDEMENRLGDVFVTKDEFAIYKSELMNKLDKILKGIQTP